MIGREVGGSGRGQFGSWFPGICVEGLRGTTG